jgi:hypothetical protein
VAMVCVRRRRIRVTHVKTACKEPGHAETSTRASACCVSRAELCAATATGLKPIRSVAALHQIPQQLKLVIRGFLTPPIA